MNDIQTIMLPYYLKSELNEIKQVFSTWTLLSTDVCNSSSYNSTPSLTAVDKHRFRFLYVFNVTEIKMASSKVTIFVNHCKVCWWSAAISTVRIVIYYCNVSKVSRLKEYYRNMQKDKSQEEISSYLYFIDMSIDTLKYNFIWKKYFIYILHFQN